MTLPKNNSTLVLFAAGTVVLAGGLAWWTSVPLADGGPRSAVEAELRDSARFGTSKFPRESRRTADTWRTQAAEAMDLGPGEERAERLTALLQGWVETKPAEALAWVRALGDAQLRDRLLIEAGCVLAAADGRAAIALAVEIPGATERAECVRRVVYEWAWSDLPTAMGWVEGVEDPALRETAAFSLLLAWTEQDAPAAAAFAADHFGPGEVQDRAALHVALRWSQTDPEAALTWVERFGEQSLRAETSHTILENWLQRDPATARSWLAHDALAGLFPALKEAQP